MRPQRWSVLFLLVSAVALLVSCAPGAGGQSSVPANDGSSGVPASSGPKTIRLAVDASSEPAGGMMLIGRGGAVGLENQFTFHAGLTVYDQDSKLMPRLAERVPTLENGDWKVNPDSSMEVT